MESEGTGDGHQYGPKPRTPELIPIAGKLTYSEEELGHWTPAGIEPTDYDDDDSRINRRPWPSSSTLNVGRLR